MATIIQGNVAIESAVFTNQATGAPVDPTAVTFSYRLSTGLTVLTYEGSSTPALGVIARTAAGAYVAWIDLTNISTSYRWRWDGTGAGQGSLPGMTDITSNAV